MKTHKLQLFSNVNHMMMNVIHLSLVLSISHILFAILSYWKLTYSVIWV